MNIETKELIVYLNKIAVKSLAGEIPWSQPTPSTYQWLKQVKDISLYTTIQKANIPRQRGEVQFSSREDHYLFQVQDSKKNTLISLSSKERPDFLESLVSVYKGAERGMDSRASFILKTLLD